MYIGLVGKLIVTYVTRGITSKERTTYYYVHTYTIIYIGT